MKAWEYLRGRTYGSDFKKSKKPIFRITFSFSQIIKWNNNKAIYDKTFKI